MITGSPQSIARYNAGGPWLYTNGYRIEHAWGCVYVIIGPNGDSNYTP